MSRPIKSHHTYEKTLVMHSNFLERVGHERFMHTQQISRDRSRVENFNHLKEGLKWYVNPGQHSPKKDCAWKGSSTTRGSLTKNRKSCLKKTFFCARELSLHDFLDFVGFWFLIFGRSLPEETIQKKELSNLVWQDYCGYRKCAFFLWSSEEELSVGLGAQYRSFCKNSLKLLL